MDAHNLPRMSRFGNRQLFFVIDPEFAEEISATRWSRTHFGYLESICTATKRRLWLHRYVWELRHGWVPKCIDHINGIRWDCRISNLRPATASLNSRNRRVRRRVDLPVGVGVRSGSRSTGRNPFYARIRTGGRQVTIGYYPTADAAGAAYLRECAVVSERESLEAQMEAVND